MLVGAFMLVSATRWQVAEQNPAVNHKSSCVRPYRYYFISGEKECSQDTVVKTTLETFQRATQR